jgi:PAS domain S-box-containing protein
MKFYNLRTLFGEVMTTGKTVISNNPSADPRRGGLPKGHPPLNCFLGLPMHRDGKLVGMIGIANRSGGYNKKVVKYLQPMLSTCGAIIEEYRNEERHKKAEEALRESEKKFSNLFHHSNDAIFIHDLKGNILDVNKRVLDQFGYTKSEILSLKIRDIHPPEELETSQEAFKTIVKNHFVNFETIFKKKDGKVFPAELSSSLFKVGESEVIQGIVRDITERRQAEAELIKHRGQLEDKVKKRTKELLDSNKNLKVEVRVRKQAEKKLLRYQNQLQLLTSQLSLIEENEKRRIASELHDGISQPSPGLKKIIKEIRQLIEQTIKETRTLTFELSPPILYELGLSQAVQWLIDQFREKHGLKITFVDDGIDKPFDNSTRFILFQAVRELLVNIVKHAQASKVIIKMAGINRKLRITIEDDGIGFSKPAVNSSGYGLFNIRERMNHIKGNFEIKSIPGNGTGVTLDAPFMPGKKSGNKRSTYENKNLISRRS